MTIASVAQAQPTFTSNECFHQGLSSHIAWVFSTGSYAAAKQSTGDNHTWDFSAESWPAPTGEYVFQSGSDGAEVFSNSEINEYGLATFSRDLYYSYSEDNDTLYYDGLVVSGNPYHYEPPMPYLTFPMNFNDSTHHHHLIYTTIGANSVLVGSSSRSWKYDGYGTVQLPYGTFENVYRISTDQTDSTYITNFVTNYRELIWFRASDGLPVLRFTAAGDFINVHYSGDGSADVHDEISRESILVYPNPADHLIRISDHNIGQIEIFNLTGSRITQIKGTNGVFDVKELPIGVYFVGLPDGRKVRLVRD
jgi:hypothetical protein